ncbi:3'-5' exonuclease [Streptomyces sp. NPDC088106]|uniref:3'-5' exonuclease n=1 Tax=Streptomyces TaxID=1883 RepID=UPI002164C844|nr:DEAD/DEAH box helicase [Streptomyces thermocarboxydus]WSB42141.1 AAA family ATPase [Streptomyces cellulosae]WTF21144.1 AAA family ATPase [Streptomyces cellulosae]
MGLPTLVGRQPHVAYLPSTGHQVVLGTAGTGKTLMAIVRALYLSNPQVSGSGRTLVVTYNNSLASYLSHLAEGASSEIDIRTYGRFSRGYLASLGHMKTWNDIAGAWRRRALITSAVNRVSTGYRPHQFFSRDTDWFQDELAWITGMGIRSREDYLAAERLGRKTPLTSPFREIVWKILEEYRDLRTAAGHQYDWTDIGMAVRDHLATDSRPRLYRHVIIDEGQDLAPEEIRSLVDAVDPDGSITFFGDYAQQIYGQAMSWRACGLQVRHIEQFKDNYRNSTAIAEVAIALSSMPFFGKVDDLVAPVAPRSIGPKPTLVECTDEAQEIAIIQDAAKRLGSVGTVAIVARTWADVNRACRGLQVKQIKEDKHFWTDAPGIYCTTYHSAKGLEFDAVLMPFCGANKMPLPDVVKAFGAGDAAERESKLLYVAITRAKSDLLITYSGEKTALLPSDPNLFVQVNP